MNLITEGEALSASTPSQHPAANYIQELFRAEDFICLTAIERGSNQTVNHVLTLAEATSEETIADLTVLNEEGWSIFACLQPIKIGHESRRKEDIADVRRVFLDFDHDAEIAYNRILTCGLVPEPQWVIQTSPGKLQMVWNVEPMAPAELEELLDALIKEFNADPACSDVSRVLRLPGFRNNKYSDRPLVELRDSPFLEPVAYPRAAFKVFSKKQASSTSTSADSGFKRLCEAVGFRPLVRRMNALTDPRFHVLDGDLIPGRNVVCPFHDHKNFDAQFGTIPSNPLVAHCFGRCAQSNDRKNSWDVISAVAKFDKLPNNTEAARRICEEEGLNFNAYVPPEPPCILGGKRIDATGLKQNECLTVENSSPAAAKCRFALPQVMGTHRDYLIAPALGQEDGWFPRGDVSVIGGSSGSNKSTLMFDLLDAQRHGEKFLGHSTFGLPYLILTADRGGNAQRRTLERMGLADKNVPMARLNPVVGAAAVEEIKRKIETAEIFPAVVFVEGGDMLVEDASKLHFVVPFMEALQELARYYHLAIVLSVGAPKVKAGEGYSAKRDCLFGSVAWGRMSETIALLQFPGGEDTSFQRELSVLLRNGPAEEFQMVLENGKLIIEQQEQAEPPEVAWFKRKALESQNAPDLRWFTVGDLASGLAVSRSSAFRRIQEALAHGHIVTKPGPKRGQGGATMYRWNDSSSNPLLADGEDNPGSSGTLFTAA